MTPTDGSGLYAKSSSSSPVERLADIIHSRKDNTYARDVLGRLVATLYHASTRLEEQRFISCVVVLPEPPPYSPFLEELVRFRHNVPLTANSLAKLAKAAPNWSTYIGLSRDCTKIVGLFDQGLQRFRHLEKELSMRPEFPARFAIEITGIAHLSVFVDGKLIARSKHNEIIEQFPDVLSSGPVAQKLYAHNFNLLAERAFRRKQLNDADGNARTEYWVRTVIAHTISALVRSAVRVGHGGAFLFLPDSSTPELSLKYPISYRALRRALSARVARLVEMGHSDLRHASGLRRFQRLADEEHEGAEMNVALLAFVSALTQVDGLVVIEGGFSVTGFGVEILTENNPPTVYQTRLETGSKLTRADFNHFGTRHRSMMRYCFKHHEAVGCVISQDGDVRFMTRVGAKLIVWEDVNLISQRPVFFAPDSNGKWGRVDVR